MLGAVSLSLSLSLFLSVRLSLSLPLRGPRLKRLKETRGESGSHPHLPLSCLAQSHRCSDRLVSERTALMTDAAGAGGQACWTEVALSSSARTQTPLTSLTVFFFLLRFMFFFLSMAAKVTWSQMRVKEQLVAFSPSGSTHCVQLKHCNDQTMIQQSSQSS